MLFAAAAVPAAVSMEGGSLKSWAEVKQVL